MNTDTTSKFIKVKLTIKHSLSIDNPFRTLSLSACTLKNVHSCNLSITTTTITENFYTHSVNKC